MAVYEVTVIVTAPDNFDEEGVLINVEEALNEHPDFDNAEVINIDNVS